MPFAASDIVGLLVLIVWACLTPLPPVNRHPLFIDILHSQIVLSEILSAASLSFCPGLFEAIQATSPPPLSFFLGLPSDNFKRWAVYVLVLKKKGEVSLIYIGSGTDGTSGVRARWRKYDRGDSLPVYVKAALDQGYTIVHKGLLLWSPIPSATNVPRLRILFVAMEASFSFLFWAMYSKSKDYGMGACCPWDRASFSYRGLCSHNALLETVAGDFDLSPEQLEELAAVAKERKRAYSADFQKRQREEDPDRVREMSRIRDARSRQNEPEKFQARQQCHSERTKGSKKYYCATCDRAFKNPSDLDRHNSGKRHLQKVAKAQSSSRST